MNIIEVDELNYKAYQKLDIAAFSIASPGAMGEGGSIYIIDTEGQIYHANNCHGDNCIQSKHIKDIIPVIEDIQFHIFGCESNNEKWMALYLGFGNYLVLIKSLYEGFCKKRDDANLDSPARLFQHWPGFMMGLLGKEEEHLTMSKIWEYRHQMNV
jgi:hypothetical protein